MFKPKGVNQEEREFEVGMDESWKATLAAQDGILFSNQKRTYDAYQDIDLTKARDNHAFQMKVLYDAQENTNTMRNLTAQLLQNGITASQMGDKQAVRHSDIAIDRQWNVDEVAQAVSENAIFQDAISAAVVAAVTTMANQEEKV
jgi:hypothetical protein